MRDANRDHMGLLAQSRIANWAGDLRDVIIGMTQGGKPFAKPRPFGARSDKPAGLEPMCEQGMAQREVNVVGVGQDQVVCM